MPPRYILLFSTILASIVGGVTVALGLMTTPIGILFAENGLVLFTLGTLASFVVCSFIASFTLLACSEIFFVAMGHDRQDSLNYLSSAIFLGRAGDLKIIDKGEVRTIPQRGISPGRRGFVIISHGNAVVFEKFGQVTRVGSKGWLKTKPFELIHAIVDLSLQQRQKQVTFFTKDGIPLQIEVRVYFQIHSGGHKPTSGDMYPFLEQAVLNAVYAVPNWQEYTIETAIALLRSMMAGRYLYEIYDPLKKLTSEDKPMTQLNVLRDELQTSLERVAFNWGVRIHNVEIDVKPPKEIEDQAMAFEKTRMEQQVEIENARTENIRIKEFMSQTGGTVEDYTLLRLSERMGESTAIPPPLEQMMSDAFERASLRTSRRQERKLIPIPPVSDIEK